MGRSKKNGTSEPIRRDQDEMKERNEKSVLTQMKHERIGEEMKHDRRGAQRMEA
jgi:hypothetical protein